ncbi:MAG: hypothetical protein QOK31_1966 [Solirubrobacteraceae bacterium]|nr:hypothetical protein [Solirubrobacteraceae bacterium]
MPRLRLRPRLSYANVASTLALVFALTGGAYAAVALRANSVATKHLRRSAVTSAKIKDGTIGLADLGGRTRRALRGAKGDRGLQGLQGLQGLKGATGTVDTSGFYDKGAADGRFTRGAAKSVLLQDGQQALLLTTPRGEVVTASCAPGGVSSVTFQQVGDTDLASSVNGGSLAYRNVLAAGAAPVVVFAGGFSARVDLNAITTGWTTRLEVYYLPANSNSACRFQADALTAPLG